MNKTLTYRHFGPCEAFDIIADTYTCVIRRHGSGYHALHFYMNGSRLPDLVLKPDAGFTARPGNCKLLTKIGSFSGNVDVLELVYAVDDTMQTTLRLYPDRVEMTASYTGEEEVDFQELYLGRGSLLYTDQVFSLAVQGVQPGICHYQHPDEAIILSPGLMSPPPWCFSARQANGNWMGFALEPWEDELDFVSFCSHPGIGHEYCWIIDYRNSAVPRTEYTSPALVFRFDMPDEFTVFSTHLQTLLETGKVTLPERTIPEWQYGVSACGWRWQHSLRENCTQELYEQYLQQMEKHGLDCDTMIIDDFWGSLSTHGVWKTEETRWPDLRGFIDKQHAEDRHVLLWVCTNAHGLPEDERRGNLHNIESDAWKIRLLEDARRILSDAKGCYNADGIKFDFTAAFPKAVPGDRFRGVGFIRERFRLVYEAVTAVKPDAMVVCQSLNPYFIPYQTVIRLNDYFALPEHGLDEMRIRSNVAKAIGCGLPIDTDHTSFSTLSYQGGYDFYREMDTMGTVSLYINQDDINDPEFCDILKDQIQRNLKRRK